MADQFSSVSNAIDGDTLRCASCGSYLIHHSKVEIWDRDEDEEKGLHVCVDFEDVSIDRSMAGNPSDRRHGLAIYFWCENCKANNALVLSQHKGNTFIHWSTAEELSKQKLADQDEDAKISAAESEQLLSNAADAMRRFSEDANESSEGEGR